MKKARIMAAALSLLMAAGSLSGCTSSKTTTSDETKTDTTAAGGTGAAESSAGAAAEEKEPVELTIWVTSRNKDDWDAKFEEEFLKQHPWITLNKVVKEGDPANEFYQAVAAGNAPDLANPSFTMMSSFMAAGICEPLNRYVDQWEDWPNYTKEYTDMFTQNGNVYAIPTTVSPMLFGYNKELFKEAGIANPPKTWDEALEDAKKINDPSKQIAGYSTLAAEWTEWFFQYYVWQAGGDLTKENADGTATLTFTDPAVIKAAEYYQELRKAGVLQSDLTLKFTDLVNNFGLGKVGMMPFAGDWVTEAAAKGIDPDDIGLTLPPVGPSGEPVTAIAGICWVINAKTDPAKKDAAWEYIKWYNDANYYKSYFENLASKGTPNPVIIPRDDMSVTDFYQFPQEYKDVLEAAKKVGRFEFYGKADFGIYVDRAVQKILVDPNADPQKEFEQAQELCEKEALPEFNKEHKR